MPKLSEFDECFPGKIGFGDIDGIVEIRGRALILEWKTSHEIPTGQRIMFSRITKTGDVSGILVTGDVVTMKTLECARFFKGTFYEWERAPLDAVKSRIRAWVNWAISNET